jgi:hypothetical protein
MYVALTAWVITFVGLIRTLSGAITEVFHGAPHTSAGAR